MGTAFSGMLSNGAHHHWWWQSCTSHNLPTACPSNQGFVPGMRVPGTFYVNSKLKDLLFDELQQSVTRGEVRCLGPNA